MRTIIAGSRTIQEYRVVLLAVRRCGFSVTAVVSGGARGVDKLGERFAKEFKLPYEVYEAKWDWYGKSAGYKRNMEMANNAEALIAIWDGKSAGTKHMIQIAKDKGLKTFVLNFNGELK